MRDSAPLSPAARELLELGSHVEPPSPEQQQRMDRALALLVAVDRAAPPSLPARLQRGPFGSGARRDGAGHSLASTRPWLASAVAARAASGAARLVPLRALPGWLALGAVAAAASVSFWMGRVSAPLEQPAPRSALEAPAPLAALEQPAPVLALALPALELPALELPPTEAVVLAASASPSRGEANAGATSLVPARLDPPAPAARRRPERIALDGLAAEVARLARAEAALRKGHARNAWLELEAPAAHLVEQTTALRAVAECELGERTGAANGRELLRRWPGSAFLPRVRAACGW